MRDLNQIDTIVIHSTLQRESETFYMEALAADHYRRGVRSGMGSKTAYHYVILRDGDVIECRKWEEPVRLSGNVSENGLGICLVGGLNDEGEPGPGTYTTAQWKALFDLVNLIMVTFPRIEILGHRDVFVSSTKNGVCPAFDVPTFATVLRSLEPRERSNQ